MIINDIMVHLDKINHIKVIVILHRLNFLLDANKCYPLIDQIDSNCG